MLGDVGTYGSFLTNVRLLEDLLARWPSAVRRAVLGVGPLRGLVMALASTRHDVVAIVRAGRGWRSLLLVRALFGRHPKLAVLHFIDHPARARGWGAAIDRAWRPIDRWATRHAVLRAQVLSPAEHALYPASFGVEPERFILIPYPWRMSEERVGAPASSRRLVLSAGRAMCDWETLFGAAAGKSWPLLVICTASDRARVDALNQGGRATVMCDVVPDEMTRTLFRAAVCVLSLEDTPVSHGQIRLCNAVDAGAAVVATRVSALEGYVEDGRTALLVAPRDAGAMRAAIERLLADPPLRDALAGAAFERAAGWTATMYLRSLERFLAGTAGG